MNQGMKKRMGRYLDLAPASETSSDSLTKFIQLLPFHLTGSKQGQVYEQHLDPETLSRLSSLAYEAMQGRTSNKKHLSLRIITTGLFVYVFTAGAIIFSTRIRL